MKFSQILSFLTFSGISEFDSIQKKFTNCHERGQNEYPYWSAKATRKKLVMDFWVAETPKHFASVVMIPFLVAFFTHQIYLHQLMSWITMFGMVLTVFVFMMIFVYSLEFHYLYLPTLDSYIEGYADKKVAIQKCKENQISVRAIIIVQHVFQKLSGIDGPGLTKEYLKLLESQYGVSIQGLDKAFQEIFMKGSKSKSSRMTTELVNSFEEAGDYFDGLKSERGIAIVNELKEKVLKERS